MRRELPLRGQAVNYVFFLLKFLFYACRCSQGHLERREDAFGFHRPGGRERFFFYLLGGVDVNLPER